MVVLGRQLPLRPIAALAALVSLATAGFGAALPTTHLGPRSVASPAAESSAERDFEQLVRKLELRERQLEREIDALRPRIDTVRRRMLARGRAYYRQVRAGLLPIGGGFDALVDHAATVERLRTALVRDVGLRDTLAARLEVAQSELRRVTAEKAPLLVQREAMRRAKAAMQQAEERRAAFARAFGGDPASAHVAIYGALGGAGGEAGGSFANMKGRLPFPLVGRAELLADGAEPRGGVRLMASRDSAVRAVFAGRVVFVGPAEQGQTVALDHGEGYYSVYGGLQRVEVREREQLTGRTRLGWVLRHGASMPTLYFEVRRGKRLLDAVRWLGL